MGWKTEKNALISHNRPPTTAEMEAFGVIHKSASNIVLLPVIVNGTCRFALAVVRAEGGNMSSLILGYLAAPDDELMSADGGVCNPMKADQKRDNKHLH